MDLATLFRDADLLAEDKIAFAKSIEVCLRLFGRDKCWRMNSARHRAFAGFSTNQPQTLRYKGADARPLILGMSGQFQPDETYVAIRKSVCKSPYCLNPEHYYWGTRADVMMQVQSKQKKKKISPEVIQALRTGRQEGQRVLDLSRKYKVPYHTARRICAGETYENISETTSQLDSDLLWATIQEVCKRFASRYPEEAREYNLGVHVANQIECPWHRKDFPGHKGNFGLMGECLDCLEEIKKGRCSVDVTNFDMQWYWQVKRFWEQVDIRGEDECWSWTGSTRKNNTESTAYFPSPFHVAKTQSASRVAFWLSRGYMGKYRVFARPECQKFCCNPRHLHIREFKDLLPASKIGEIKLNHGNVFEHYRKTHAEAESGPAQQLPSP
jgi:hypothetical protein